MIFETENHTLLVTEAFITVTVQWWVWDFSEKERQLQGDANLRKSSAQMEDVDPPLQWSLKGLG